LNRAKI